MKNLILKILFFFFLLPSIVLAADYPNIPNDIDRKTYCDKNGKKFGHAVILLDVTSELDKPQIDFARDMVFSEQFFTENFKPFTKFSYLLIDNKRPQEQRFIFSKCRPKTGKNTPEWEKNTWRENKKILDKFFKEFKSEALKTHSKAYQKTGGSKNSFIYETLAYVFQNPKFEFGKKEENRTLVIVSDMMQNSERLSFYKNCNANSQNAKCPSFKSFMNNLSDKNYLMATSPKGKGVNLYIFYINNRYETNKEIDRSLIKLWENYFKDRGFENIKIIRQLDIN